MKGLAVTNHAALRMAQRGIRMKEAELIALIGAAVPEGYLVRNRDYQELERLLKLLLQQFRRVVGKRLVVTDGKIITAYHASKCNRRYLIKNAYGSDR